MGVTVLCILFAGIVSSVYSNVQKSECKYVIDNAETDTVISKLEQNNSVSLEDIVNDYMDKTQLSDRTNLLTVEDFNKVYLMPQDDFLNVYVYNTSSDGRGERLTSSVIVDKLRTLIDQVGPHRIGNVAPNISAIQRNDITWSVVRVFAADIAECSGFVLTEPESGRRSKRQAKLANRFLSLSPMKKLVTWLWNQKSRVAPMLHESIGIIHDILTSIKPFAVRMADRVKRAVLNLARNIIQHKGQNLDSEGNRRDLEVIRKFLQSATDSVTTMVVRLLVDGIEFAVGERLVFFLARLAEFVLTLTESF